MTATDAPSPGPPGPIASPPSGPSGPGGPVPGAATLIAAAAAAGAGLVHAAAAGSHGGDTTLMWLFAATAAAQLGSAGALLLWPGRIAAFAAAAVNGAAVLAWVGSRTVGLAGPLAGVEPVGTQDLIAAVLGAVATIAAVASLWSAREASPGRRRPASPAVVALTTSAVLLLAVPAMAAEHTHGDHDHDHAAAAHAHSDDAAHDHGDGAAHDHSDDEAHGGGAHGGDSADGVGAAADAGPIVSIDDPRLTKSQRREATALLTNSRVALGAFPDEAAVVAAGYRSIGDGRAVGRFEHFVHPGYMNDGRELDPGAIESIVLQKQADGSKRVMSAMYILERGKTMADVPDIAGSLTTWHDHQNLCWDESGTRLAGVLRDGVCVPGGTFRPTAPMLHVWVDDPPCGPFTGIEGHGGASCEHTHA